MYFIISIECFFTESGRFVPDQKNNMDRTYLSDSSTIETEGKAVAMYRIKTNAIDQRNVADVCNM